MLRQSILGGVLVLSAGLALADPFSYDYVEAGVGEVDEGEAVFAGFSRSLGSGVYGLGSIYNVDFGPVDGMYLEGGLGYHAPVSGNVNAFVNGQLLYANVDTRRGDDDDLGAIARAGLKFKPSDKVELEGALAMSSNDFLIDDGLGLEIAGHYYFDPRFSLGLGVASDTELDGVFLKARYHFLH